MEAQLYSASTYQAQEYSESYFYSLPTDTRQKHTVTFILQYLVILSNIPTIVRTWTLFVGLSYRLIMFRQIGRTLFAGLSYRLIMFRHIGLSGTYYPQQNFVVCCRAPIIRSKILSWAVGHLLSTVGA
jgi:hypothetical protein